MFKYSVFFLLICICRSGNSQIKNPDNYPQVGKLCPDFTLRNIRYYSSNQATRNDFKGKWLILDFWNKHCGACFSSFPKVSAMQKEFGEKVQFISVGIQDPEKQIETIFAKYRSKENLSMPCAFDSLLAQKWEIYTAPHIIIIDDHEIVRGITNSLYPEQIQTFLDGKEPELAKTYDPIDTIDNKIPFDDSRPFLMNGNGGADSNFLLRSIISRFNLNKQSQFIPESMSESVKEGRFQVLGVPLFFLFNYAYFGEKMPGGYAGDSISGRCQNFPALEIRDSSVFQYSFGQDKNLFAYSLIMDSSKASIDKFQRILQSDLKNYFDLDARIEMRKCRCWKITATEKVKMRLRSKGGIESIKPTKFGYKAKNLPYSNIQSWIYQHFPLECIFDETGIVGNINISIENDIWTNIQDLQDALRPSGLKLEPDFREMKVLVIRDMIQH
jgi:thiol-disulfide isomerase/thioredoxin